MQYRVTMAAEEVLVAYAEGHDAMFDDMAVALRGRYGGRLQVWLDRLGGGHRAIRRNLEARGLLVIALADDGHAVGGGSRNPDGSWRKVAGFRLTPIDGRLDPERLINLAADRRSEEGAAARRVRTQALLLDAGVDPLLLGDGK